MAGAALLARLAKGSVLDLSAAYPAHGRSIWDRFLLESFGILRPVEFARHGIEKRGEGSSPQPGRFAAPLRLAALASAAPRRGLRPPHLCNPCGEEEVLPMRVGAGSHAP